MLILSADLYFYTKAVVGFCFFCSNILVNQMKRSVSIGFWMLNVVFLITEFVLKLSGFL